MWQQALIPVVVPLVLAVLKVLFPKIPKVWIPWLAPILGAAAEIGLYYAGAVQQANPLLGAALGQAGVGLREMVDQLKKTLNKGDEE